MIGEIFDPNVFEGFPKIYRFSRDIVITEKIDGTNAQIAISDDRKQIVAGSRSRIITPENDNQGFAKWVEQNREELTEKLGPGRHFGEWWGLGIQRGYGLKEKRFSLFNTHRWDNEARPNCCYVVPTLASGVMGSGIIDFALHDLKTKGSFAAPGFMKPEGIVIFHKQSGYLFKKTLENDDKGKEFGA